MERQINLKHSEMQERCGISSSHWRTLQSIAAGDADKFDYLIEDYKKKKIIKAEKIASRPAAIPASEYDGYVLSEDEFRLAIYEYIPVALKSLTNKKYHLKGMDTSKLGTLEDLQQDIFYEVACKTRKKSGKTMYQSYLENVNLWKGYRQMVYRAAENLITDRVKRIVKCKNEIPLDTIVYESKGRDDVRLGDLIRHDDSYFNIYASEFLEACKEKEVKGVNLYDIANRLLEDTGERGEYIKLREICKEYGINPKRVQQMFEEINVREIFE